MKFHFILLGILLAFMGMATASPIGTPTIPDNVTKAALGPRRNGYGDLPSTVIEYNTYYPNNSVPDYVMASDPNNGNNAIIYNQVEIYTAMQQGYEVLQRTRDPAPTGGFVIQGNILYPMVVDQWEIDLADTYMGQFGTNYVSPAGRPIGTLYMWPLTWANSFTGYNQQPGDDRVVFNQDGIYMGVITRRPSDLHPVMSYRWCPPTDAYGRWSAAWIGGYRGWNYPGVPPTGAGGYVRPSRWNVAANQRQLWYNNNAMAPVGSISLQYNVSNPPPVDLSPPEGTYNASDPLQFPPMDNSTGGWQLYVPQNVTSNLTSEFASPPADCTFAATQGTGLYWQQCQSSWTQGSDVLRYRITISGTGQNTKGWCSGVMDNIHGKCGGNGNPESYYHCNQKYAGTVAFSKSTDPSDSGYNNYFYGIDMHFYMKWPWAESDADHTCVAAAINAASCAGAGVISDNGQWCRDTSWSPATPLLEWSSEMGPA